MAGIPGDASDRRCGVRLGTVTRSFESGAGSAKHAGSQFLTDIRTSCDFLRVNDGNKIENMCWIIKCHLVDSKFSETSFEHLCEGLVSLLYYGFVYSLEGRSNMILSVFQYFWGKWFAAYDGSDLNKFIFEVEKVHQKSCFASVLLLYSQYGHPLSLQASMRTLEWPSSKTSAPQWLQEVLASKNNTYKNLNVVLFKFLYYMSTEDVITPESDYLSVCSIFPRVCQKYKQANYMESLKLLSSIERANCDSYLLGWYSLMGGLCMEHVGKLQCALKKYKEALKHSRHCYHALYYSARVFKKMNLNEEQLECLKILTSFKVDEPSLETTFQSALLKYCLPSTNNFTLRTLWLLATSYLSNKKWNDLLDTCKELLSKWTEECNVLAVEKQKYLISPSDDIPTLPPKSCVEMVYMASLMFLGENQEVMSDQKDEEANCDWEDFHEMADREKLSKICSLTCQVMAAESLLQQGQSDNALSKCGRLLTQVESLYSTETSWKMIVFSLKAYLYKLLLVLYGQNPLNKTQNCAHFTRLVDHCRAMIKKTRKDHRESDCLDQLMLIDITQMILTTRGEQLNNC